MSDTIAPLATDDEWNGKMVRNVAGNVHAYVAPENGHPTVRIVAPNAVAEFDRAEALLPLINDALDAGSPYRIASRHVAALVNVVQGYRDSEDLAVLDELASILTAVLQPANLAQ